ncbi:2-aminoethylphosphonate--pyruvate transaminase [Agrilactobacillus fermenti]|uniref:2-aminoethylphosphonate--pyruvate transaminase n=1 Tax=Agrilactobacillus fermenti TaxID=2586909 RepID=UPI001E389185|nr:2-aminoethylphosphonate--pyruvate transaminase [Agrilactobacillus fermenti]
MKAIQSVKQPYLLLTPGPLSTSDAVKQAMLIDYCTWDEDYKKVTREVQQGILNVADLDEKYVAVLLQGSGSYGVESVISSVIPKEGKLLIVANGAYGKRMAEMADCYGIEHVDYLTKSTEIPKLEKIQVIIQENPDITHFAMVHCETTTGILNPIETIVPWVADQDIVTIVDAMSSFGGIPIDFAATKIDFLISSANKCLQGVPGVTFVIADKDKLVATAGNARTLSLDLYDQYVVMSAQEGKWRFTSPTHVVHALHEALRELRAEGGVTERYERYRENQRLLSMGMHALGYLPVIDAKVQSPIITSFYYPNEDFDFNDFYLYLKHHGFVIYPGKLTELDTFRIGNIGEVYSEDIQKLLHTIAAYNQARVVL